MPQENNLSSLKKSLEQFLPYGAERSLYRGSLGLRACWMFALQFLTVAKLWLRHGSESDFVLGVTTTWGTF